MSVELVGELRVARPLEGAHPVRLQFVRLPDALHRAQRDADGLGHRPAGPMRRLVRRVGAGQRHHARHRLGRDRRLAGLARLVAQQTVHALFGEALLPPPHHRPADADLRRDLLHRAAACRGEHDPRPLDVFARPVAIGRDRLQPLPVQRAHITHTVCAIQPEFARRSSRCESAECVRALADQAPNSGHGPQNIVGWQPVPIQSPLQKLCSRLLLAMMLWPMRAR